MRRDVILAQVAGSSKVCDVLVIGGGATGLGTALDAASRGLSVVLLEKSDFASETSSRSTKLIHGGVRYLKQGRMGLVREALRERRILQHNAPALVHSLPFIIPTRSWWETLYYTSGLKVYDRLAGDLSLGPTEVLSCATTSRELSTLRREKLKAGVKYWDAQFNDALLAVSLARTLAEFGGLPLNYCEVTQLMSDRGRIGGVQARDLESGRTFEVRSRVVVNATGVWTDEIRRKDEPQSATSVRVSQGAHIVVGREFLPGASALMVPKTEDGRVLFAIPWMGRCLIGTTDTPMTEARSHPKPLAAEVDFLIREAGRYLQQPIRQQSILSVFAGLRPLIATESSQSTASVSREHRIDVSSRGLISVVGGKWTTYRSMAEEIVNIAMQTGGWQPRPCVTTHLAIQTGTTMSVAATNDTDQPLHPNLPLTPNQIRQSAQEDMARTVEDVIARRSRCLFMDVAATLQIVPRVAEILGNALGYPQSWCEGQVQLIRSIAKNYQVSDSES